MILFKHAKEIADYLEKKRVGQYSIGFIPTMGALHNGHISLIDQCKKSHSITVCSIFVNPTQFNNPEDFKKYPVTIEQDIYLLEKNGCNVLFMPSVKEVYPKGDDNNKHYDLGYLENILEGKFRPGHFQGVCKVVERLLNIVNPDSLFAGQKDYQQCMVLKKLLQLMNSKIEFIIGETVREKDGLAMSSRNLRLNKDEREKASEIFKVLNEIKNNLQQKNIEGLKMVACDSLNAKGFKVDYVEIADASNLKVVETWDGHTQLVALVAAFLNDIRLIDNLRITA